MHIEAVLAREPIPHPTAENTVRSGSSGDALHSRVTNNRSEKRNPVQQLLRCFLCGNRIGGGNIPRVVVIETEAWARDEMPTEGCHRLGPLVLIRRPGCFGESDAVDEELPDVMLVVRGNVVGQEFTSPSEAVNRVGWVPPTLPGSRLPVVGERVGEFA